MFGKYKNLYKPSKKCDDQHKYKSITEAYRLSTT